MTSATACPGDPTAGTETASTDSTSAQSSTTDDAASTTGDEPTTTGETSGDHAPGGARIVYGARAGDGPGELFFVDCTGATPGPPIPIHTPLTGGWSVSGFASFSPSSRWMHYVVRHPELGAETWIADMSGPLPAAPVRIELPTDLAHGVAGFTHDESRLALAANQGTGGSQIYLCTLGPDGSCVPEVWGVPLAPGGGHSGQSISFSPDDTRLAYAGDPDGDGIEQVFLGGTAPGDAGEAASLSGELPPDESAITEIWFSADGGTLYYSFGSLLNGFAGIHAVDVSVDPPASPTNITPPKSAEKRLIRLRDDTSAVLQWDGAAGRGDLSFYDLDGTEAGEVVSLHDAPGRVSGKYFGFSPDGRFAFYLADTEDAPDEWDLYAVDTSGPLPSSPTKLNAPLAAGGAVTHVSFSADSTRLLYFARPASGLGVDLWTVRLDPLTAPVMLNSPLPAMGTLEFLTASDDGSRVLVVGTQASFETAELFLVETAAPGVSSKLSAPLGPGQNVAHLPFFSADSQRVFYKVEDIVDGEPVYSLHQVDIPTPGAAVQVSAEDHAIVEVKVLPPAGS
ncbi:hypothetical protein [Nannocystis punicea]|uniref:WD40-like Beta Propeller Repeat n=1 Tax=Nannocystis punicea TaxID=2995304 RepID=A0ABY7GWR3_9BACT|nr:hypothetical protein [Nannocystis poenicansa]WAS91425.1 hypothetical protein O0S08_35010 [Nannocystis poenicansa]